MSSTATGGADASAGGTTGNGGSGAGAASATEGGAGATEGGAGAAGGGGVDAAGGAVGTQTSFGSTSSGGATGGVSVPELTPDEIAEALAVPRQEFRFHHVHVNAAEPELSVAFYAQHLDATDLGWSGSVQAVRSGTHWLVFEQEDNPPAPSDLVSALFHVGFGVDDVQDGYDAFVLAGVVSETPPFNTASRLCTGGAGSPNVAFLYGPDREVFEINPAASPDLRHLHFLSSDPNGAGEWYVEHLGVSSSTPNPSETVTYCNDIQISPTYTGNLDAIQALWYPVEFAHGYYPDSWEGRSDFEPQRGRAVDHIALSVEDLDRAVTRLRAEGVSVVQFPEAALDGRVRSAFIAGPDRIEIEIVEGHVE